MSPCAGCEGGDGPLVPSPACRERFEEVLGREFSDPAYFEVHHLTVAAYRLQHPDDGSERTLALLLTALTDVDVDGPTMRRRMRWAASQPVPQGGRTALSSQRSGRECRSSTSETGGEALTITDVVAASVAEEHCAVVRRWAAQVRGTWP